MSKLNLIWMIVLASLAVSSSITTAQATEVSTTPVTNIGGYLQFHMVSANVGWTVQYTASGDSKVLRTVDGGNVWRNASPYPRMLPIMASDFMSAKQAWIVVSIGGSGGPVSSRSPVKVYATDNGGENWTRGYVTGTSMLHSTPLAIDFLNPRDGWLLLGTNGRYHITLYHTNDGGQHWTPVMQAKGGTIPSTYTKMGMTFISEEKGFVTGLGSATALYETEDGGHRWKRVHIPVLQSMSFDFARPPVFFNGQYGMMEVQYLPKGDRKIGETEYLRTTDGGAVWKVATHKSYSVYHGGGGVGDILNSRHLYLAAAGTVYRTVNGRPWQTLDVHFSSGLNYVDFVSQRVGWTFNFAGKMFRTDDGGIIWAQLHPVEVQG